jgi:peptidoglycan/LPS O-acetylase OafA/YrhL
VALEHGNRAIAVDRPSSGSSHSISGRGGFFVPSLDGLRAYAVMLVFLSHAWTAKWLPGNFGVTVFFFLSGYLITSLLRREHERSARISFRAFYLRRTLRILPPFYLVLLLASALTVSGMLPGSVQLVPALFQVFHLSNYYIIQHGWWDGRAPGTWVYWSLAVEEHFYLVFPVVYLFLVRRVPSPRRQMLLLFGVCAAVLAWRCLLVFDLHAIKDRTYVATDTRIDSILFGCILAIYGNPMLDRTRLSERRLKWFWLPLGIAGLLISFAIRSEPFQESFRYTLQGISLFPIFIVAIRYPDWGPCMLLNFRWIRFMGVLSYSFYLVHPTVIFSIQQWTNLPPLIQAVLALLVSLTLSITIYFTIEQPSARLRKRLSSAGEGNHAATPVSVDHTVDPPFSSGRQRVPSLDATPTR